MDRVKPVLRKDLEQSKAQDRNNPEEQQGEDTQPPTTLSLNNCKIGPKAAVVKTDDVLTSAQIRMDILESIISWSCLSHIEPCPEAEKIPSQLLRTKGEPGAES